MPGRRKPGGRRLRALDVVVLLAVVAAFAVAARVLGFWPAPDTGAEAARTSAPPVPLTGEAPEVPVSEPLEISIPALGLVAEIDRDPCPLTGGALDPANLDSACYYVADDRPFSLPGSEAPDVSVIAGHAAAGRPAVFDALYDTAGGAFTLREGDELLVRTKAGGGTWLVYRATDFHAIDRTDMGGDPDVWGEDATPGRLLTISCIQPRNPLAEASENVVVGWEFAGVSDTG